MRTIELTQGKVTLVDDADYGWLTNWKWCAARSGQYRKHWYARSRGMSMHRLLLPDAKMVDHIDGNGLNNQRANLRSADHVRNGQNRRKGDVISVSRYKGVHYRKDRDAWIAVFKLNGQRVLRKQFKTEIEAARAYNEAAFKHAGEFALLNQIEL